MTRRSGLARAGVTVAAPLRPDPRKRALRQALGGPHRRQVRHVSTSRPIPSIIGGLIVKLGSRMVDASLKTKLNSIRTRMKEVG